MNINADVSELLRHAIAHCARLRVVAVWSHFLMAALSVTMSGLPSTLQAQEKESFESVMQVYQDNREKGLGNYVTPDVALLAYSLVREKHIVSIERESIIPQFTDFLELLYSELLADLKQDTATTESADRDADVLNEKYIALLRALLSESPESLTEDMKAEYERVMAAEGIALSPYWERRVDYSQFKVRGRYTEDPLTRGFFRSYRYATAMLFAIQPSASTGLTEVAALRQFTQANRMLQNIAENGDLALKKRQLDELLSAQFGPADDLTDLNWRSSVAEFNQQSTDSENKPTYSASQHMLDYARRNNQQPSIYSEIIEYALLETGVTMGDVLTGWRLFASRYSADKVANQILVYPSTGSFLPEQFSDAKSPNDDKPFGMSVINGNQVKAFPTAYESAALLGNKRAREILDSKGESAFSGYDVAYLRARKQLAEATGIEALHNLVITQGSQLHDPIMADHRLESLLAFQTWQRYLEVLYSKQSYTPVGKRLIIHPERTHADLEPATSLYLALSAAARIQHKLFDSPDWLNLAEHCLTLARLSQLRAEGGDLAADDVSYLNRIDQTLTVLSGVQDRAIVTDVHTDPGSAKVVQQAIGRPHVVTVAGLRGARMSFHEFKMPLASRMTDKAWQRSLEGQ